MNMHCKSSTALAAVIIMILGVPGAAWAGEGGNDDHGRGWNKGGNEHSNIHYNNRYNGHHANKGSYHPGYYAKRPYYPHYYPQPYPVYPCNNCGNHNHNNHNHDNDKLWIGLLGGGILGYGLGVYQHSNAADQGNSPQTTSAPPPPPQYATTAPAYPCLRQREYNTKVMVGGKQVDGYGTACLQLDGSWLYGAAQPESY